MLGFLCVYPVHLWKCYLLQLWTPNFFLGLHVNVGVLYLMTGTCTVLIKRTCFSNPKIKWKAFVTSHTTWKRYTRSYRYVNRKFLIIRITGTNNWRKISHKIFKRIDEEFVIYLRTNETPINLKQEFFNNSYMHGCRAFSVEKFQDIPGQFFQGHSRTAAIMYMI